VPAFSRPSWSVPLFILGTVIFIAEARASDGPDKNLRLQAEYHEQRAEWDKACLVYEQLLRLDRTAPGIKERYQICLRRYWQVRRHSDVSYRKEVLSLDYAQSLKLYTLIRNTLLDNALDKKKISPDLLFRKGLEEFDNALAEPIFVQQYLANVKPSELRDFREFLKRTWNTGEKMSRAQALKQMRDVALAAQSALQLDGNIVLMEFACGACYALDEYTLYLTPNQLRELWDSLRGQYAGVGLTLRFADGKVLIQEVAPYSPAGEINPPLAKDDQVVSIDRKPLAQMTIEAAQDLLEGPVGSSVDVEVYSPGLPPRTIALRRRAMFMPSVVYQMKDQQIGYLHIACFQDTTLQEVDEALQFLSKSSMKALILDIRANNGGLFEVAIDVARRFLSSGVIASTLNSDPKLNTVYQARNPGALALPVVVIIDNETASAAEVLAGALKENKRARLVGQTTFGKGCTQCILKLPPAPGGVPTGGMRLTVARFFSPDGLPFTGRGITPHVAVERQIMDSTINLDPQLDAAISEAQRLLTR
jgi:carboxyl-terminal processing protease